MKAYDALTRSSRLVLSPDVVFAEVDGDTVLLDGRSGVYYALNQIGTRVWMLASGGAAMGDVHEALLAEYEVSSDELWADLTKLVGELQDSTLVTIETPTS